MATVTPVKDYEVSSEDRALVVRGLQALRASTVRAAKAEFSDEIRKLREAEVSKIDALILRFR